MKEHRFRGLFIVAVILEKTVQRFQINRSCFRLIDKVREELIRLNFPIGLRG